MSALSRLVGAAERVPLPDAVIRLGVQTLCARTASRLAGSDEETNAAFAAQMAARAIAEDTDAANAQHYEVPAAFFAFMLGPNRKYSSCFYKEPESTLQEAEEEALRQTVEHADLADGQRILELGCGWGSLSLWMARQFPNAEIMAVSNSQSQRTYIEAEAAARGLTNLVVVTQDRSSALANTSSWSGCLRAKARSTMSSGSLHISDSAKVTLSKLPSLAKPCSWASWSCPEACSSST